MGSWIDQELAGCGFADARLGKRFGMLMAQLSRGLGRTLPLACGDWSATKAAYRFLDNDRVSEADILAGHFQATQERFAATDGPMLVLHDTTEFSFTRSDPAAIGQTKKVPSGHKDQAGRQRMHTVCGMLMHCSLVVTTDGLPLGLAAIKLWTRKKFKGTNALKGKGIDGGKHTINATRIPIEEKESIRWLANLIAILCIISWRVLWLCMTNRVSPDLPARLVFTDTEIKILEHAVPMKNGSRRKTVGSFLIRLARIGGYLDRTGDPPPGNMVLWRGMARLTDIPLGFSMARNMDN